MSQALLRKALDRGAPYIKRYKSLVRYLEQIRSNHDEYSSFYERYYLQIFTIFEEAIRFMDSQVKGKKGNRTIGLNDTLALLNILLGFPKYNSSTIRDDWKRDSFDTFIDIFMDPKNDVRVRHAAFHFLVRLVDVRACGSQVPDSKHVDLLNSSLNFKVFPGAGRVVLPFYDVSRPPEIFRMPKQSGNDKEADVVEFFRILTNVISESPAFQYWWEFLKTHILRILFPAETVRILQLQGGENIGFITQKCPWQVYLLLFDLLYASYSNPERREIMTSTDADLQLVLMIFDKSFDVLTVAKAEQLEGTIGCLRRVVEAWTDLVCQTSEVFIWTELMEAKREFYYRFLVESAQKTVSLLQGNDEVFDAHMEMCYQLLNIFRHFAAREDMSNQMKSFLMQSLLGCYEALQARQRDGQKYERDLCMTVERNFMREIFIYFISIHPDIYAFSGDWKAYGDLVKRYFEETSVYDFWNITLMNLCNSMILNVFNLPPEFVGTYESYKVDVTRHIKKGRRVVVERTEDEWTVPLPIFDEPGNVDVILQLFHIFLAFFGSGNTKNYSAKLHAQKVRTIREIVKLFLNISVLKVPVQPGAAVPHPPEGNRLLELFMEPLLEACFREDVAFLYGRIDAYNTLCIIFCMSKYCVRPFRKEFLCNFYRVLMKGLADKSDPKVVDIIIRHSWSLFTFNFEGSHLLIPAYVRGCKAVIERSMGEEELNLCARRCLNSLIPLLYFYDDVQFATLDGRLREKTFDLVQLREELFNFYEKESKEKQQFSSVETLVLWGLYYFVVYEIDRTSDVRKITNLIMDSLLSSSNEVWITAHDIVTSLAQMRLISRMDANTIREMVREVCVKVLQLKMLGLDSNPKAIVSLLYTLLEVIIEIPFEYFIASNMFATLIFKMIAFARETENEEIRTASTVLLSFTLNFLNRFPLPCGSSVVSSRMTDFDFLEEIERGGYGASSKVKHYAFNGTHLYTVIETDDEDRTTYLIIRDCTGRYAWRCKYVYTEEDVTFPLRNSLLEPEVSYSGRPPPVRPPPTVPRGGDILAADSPPFHSEEIDTNKTDMWRLLQMYTDSQYPDVAGYKRNVVVPVEEQSIINPEVIHAIQSQESAQAGYVAENPPPLFDAITVPPKTRDSTWTFGTSLLSDLGLLDPSFRDRFFRLNKYHPNFYRKLKYLDDKLVERETIKVAIIYVRNSQESESAILQNDVGSPLFMEFLQSLGWEIDLASHRGYLGGLDPDGDTGLTTHYFSNSTTEVIYHVSTYMPTRAGDPVQVKKKRHLGNDWIHIVWSEHDRDYRSWTISSKFNYASIVVYPLEDPLFRIEVCKKPGVPDIGPLQQNMIIGKKYLAALVRQTAINANKVVRYTQPGYKKCYLTRKDCIDQIIEENAHQVDTDEGFFASLLREEVPEALRVVGRAPTRTQRRPPQTAGPAVPGARVVPPATRPPPGSRPSLRPGVRPGQPPPRPGGPAGQDDDGAAAAGSDEPQSSRRGGGRKPRGLAALFRKKKRN